MAAYTQFGYGSFPTASQRLATGASQQQQQQQQPQQQQQTQSTATGSAGDRSLTLSSTATTNVAELSPGPGSAPGIDCQSQTTLQQQAAAAIAVGEESGGALSPDGISQHSNVGAVVSNLNNSTAGTGGIGSVGSVAGALDGSAIANAPLTGGGSCCENGRPIMTDPVSGHTVCSCQYDSARIALSSYSRLPAASVGVYGTPYPSTDQNPYQSIGVDSSAFYSPLSNPYALKDTSSGTEMGAWTSAGLQPTTGYYSYDPMSAYGYGASYDLAARRKNATRESTATLKAWLNEHKKNPYPTKGEKIMLAIITKMTLTQVSTWFANARRRLKKENKMTWEPKNRTDDDDDAMVSDDEKDKDDIDAGKNVQSGAGIGKDSSKDEDELTEEEEKAANHSDLRAGFSYPGGYHSGLGVGHTPGYHPYHHQHAAYYQHQQSVMAAGYHTAETSHGNKTENIDPKNQLSQDCGVPIPASKPKIWSLADTVGCKTPPPAYMGQEQLMPQQQLQQQQQQQQRSIQQVQAQLQQQVHANHNMAGLGNALQQALPNVHTMQQQREHSMIGPFSGAQYSRAHTTAYGGFLGATMQQLHTTANVPYSNNSHSSSSNNNNNNNNSSSSNNTNNKPNNNDCNPSVTHTPIIPTMANTSAQQQSQAPRLHQQYAASQRAMGFPEAQPDTPPQTPPNMKVSSGASNPQPTASQAPTIATCLSNNFATSSPFNPMNFSNRYCDYSPREDCSSGSSSNSSQSPQLLSLEAPFKPLFKREQMPVSGFVPPI